MFNSILQLTFDLAEKIYQRYENGEIRDLDVMAEDIQRDCKGMAAKMLQEIIRHMNEGIREDKETRKDLGLVVKEKDRPRKLLTALGQIDFVRDYFKDKENGGYVYVLDRMLGIEKYERVGAAVGARLVTEAAKTSYARAADIVTGNEISRQTVRNQILKMETPQIEAEEGRKSVTELHLYADEDHVHMQKPEKEKGKRSQIVPLVTITEGVEAVSKGRSRTIHPVHFSDEDFDTKELWKSVEGYIDKNYDLEALEKIYVHGDGAPWIKRGLEDLAQTIHVMDGFHFYKELRKISRMLPNRHVRIALTNALKNDNRKRADEYIQDLMSEELTENEAEKIRKFGVYLLGNWEEIRRRVAENALPGSCTEGLISHVLSERFSRDPLGWSEAALGKLVMARIYLKNGGKLRKEHFRKKSEDKERYSEYADRFIDEYVKGAVDFSMFEAESPILDGSSGTQIAIRGIGQMRNHLWQ